MKIAVLGTGGVGGYYGGLLARQGYEVIFIARGAHLQAIREKGLQVKSVHGDFLISPARATDRPAEIGLVDLVLFCTKAYDTEASAQAVMPVIGDQTTVLSLQNGINAAERIGAILGMQHMVGGATWISSAVEAPGVIRQVSQFHRIVIGEFNRQRSDRIVAVYEAFQKTGITIEISDDIEKILWTKFVFISTASCFGSLTRLPIGDWRGVTETRVLVEHLMREVEAVARSHGVDLEADVVGKSLAFIDAANPAIKASMQVDVEAGRQFELESIVGVIGQKGREGGVPTPIADMIYAMLLPVNLRAIQKAI